MEKGKAVAVLALFLIAIMITSTGLPGLAHLEPLVDSGWASTIPTINGTLAPGEWTDATVRDFSLEMRTRTTGDLNRTLNARFYVKNDVARLFVAVQIFNDDYEAQNFANKWNGFAILFDDTMDGSLSAGDNGEGVTTYIASPFYTYNDLYYDGAGSWTADFFAGKTNDSTMAWSHTNPVQGAIGNWTFETMIPLVGSDGESYDFNIASLPHTVGYKLWFQEPNKGLDGVYPDDPATSQNINEITNGATFGDLTLHPLYNLTLEAGVGGTTSPAPGVYQYPYKIVVNVNATADPWFEFDHWELDGGNVGSTSIYPVTMDQNHTLKAFFHALYELKIETTTGGTTTPTPGSHVYQDGTHVGVTGTKNPGYEFDHWQLDTVDVGTANPYDVLMNQNHTLKAVFVPELSVSISPGSATILLGNSVSFSSNVAGGTPNYDYQWYVGTSPISGATLPSWVFHPAAPGVYYVHLNVTDSRGRTATSNIARVEVTEPPVGGFSVGIGKAFPVTPIAYYIAVMGLFAAATFISRYRRTNR